MLFVQRLKNRNAHVALLFFILYGVFHYFSIVSYSFLVLIAALYFKETSGGVIKTHVFSRVPLLSFLTLWSILWAIWSVNIFKTELIFARWNSSEAYNIIPHPKYISEDTNLSGSWFYGNYSDPQSLKKKINSLPEKMFYCENLIDLYPSVENYFYCAEVFEQISRKELSQEYYVLWLKKLPDLWNEDSPYWDKFLIEHTITGNRFFSEKHWDINSILEKIENR